MKNAPKEPFDAPIRPTLSADDAWRGILSLYERDGVAAACLELQDRSAVDVMVLLFSVHLANGRALVLSGADIRHLDASVAGWRAGVVQPLRAARRSCLSGSNPLALQHLAELKAHIQAAELQAERLSLDLLMAASAGLSGQPGASMGGLIGRIRDFYSSQAQTTQSDDAVAVLQALVSGRCPPGRGT